MCVCNVLVLYFNVIKVKNIIQYVFMIEIGSKIIVKMRSCILCRPWSYSWINVLAISKILMVFLGSEQSCLLSIHLRIIKLDEIHKNPFSPYVPVPLSLHV
jgi:hypothetical protein